MGQMGTDDVGERQSCPEISTALLGPEVPLVCGDQNRHEGYFPVTILGNRMAPLPYVVLEADYA